MSDNELVRKLHDDVAEAASDAQASTRPTGTSARQLARMVDDVVGKLQLSSSLSAVEYGCGVGLLALPIARRVRRFVGVDIAAKPIEVLRRRLAAEAFANAEALVGDVADADGLLGADTRFDRALMYAAFHYVRSEDEGRAVLAQIVKHLAVGGVALVGNLPLAEVAAENQRWLAGTTRLTQIVGQLGWAVAGWRSWRSIGWRLRVQLAVFRQQHFPARDDVRGPELAMPGLPAGYCLPLSMRFIEGWLRALPYRVTYEWLAPGVDTPLLMGRADLRITRVA
jgi:SAM-dependent methyltransferase